MRLADEAPVRIGRLLIEPARRRLANDDDRIAVIEPRAMQVLVALLREPGAVVSPETLFELCWNGRVVGDDAISRALSRLRAALAKVADDVVRIETVPRVGHRLVIEPAVEPAAGEQPRQGRATPLLVLCAGLVLVLLAAVLIFAISGSATGPGSTGTRLAVLPFRDLSGSNVYLLEGLREQIRDDLARADALEVVGAASTDMLGASATSAEAGRRLGVTHVLAGDIAVRGSIVRVRLALRQTTDDELLWAETISGRFDDLRALQETIGARVTSALHTEVRPALSQAARGSSEAYPLYLAARGLIRRRNRAGLATARELLERAARMDPNFAPAWSSLAQAMWIGADQDSADAWARTRPQALANARRALALAPDLAEAHGVLGMILGFDSPEAHRHIVRAAELEPRTSELQYWRGHAHGARNEFGAQLTAYRRAMRLDPLWHPPILAFVEAGSMLGYHREVEAEISRFVRSAAPVDAAKMTAFYRMSIGDSSGSIVMFARFSQLRPPGRGNDVGKVIAMLLRRMQLPDAARRFHQLPSDMMAIWDGGIPAAEAVRSRINRTGAGDFNNAFVILGLKRLVNAGRAGALADAFDTPDGLLGIGHSAGFRPRPLISNAAVVALTLRQAGRFHEADRLLALADRVIAAALREPVVPAHVLANAAEIRAVMGRNDEALAFLERAVDAGWRNWAEDRLDRFDQEPGFSGLRGDPRFAQIVARLDAMVARERRELIAILPQL